MKNALVRLSLLAATCLITATTLAADVRTPEVAVDFQRLPGDTQVWNAEAALNALNHRLAEDLGNGGGWAGVGKARLKLVGLCSAPQQFKGVLLSGFEWKRIGTGTPERYTGTITKIRCQ
jgi:hypothetical protein